MTGLAWTFSLAGYRTHFVDFPSTRSPIEELTKNYLYRALRELQDVPILHIVTHSLGGIMLRYHLQNRPIPNLGRVVMLAPGNEGSAALSIYDRIPAFRYLLGPAGLQSRDDENCFACGLDDHIHAETGVIAGTLPMDIFSYSFMRWPHDGRIEVKDTKFKGMKDHIALPVSHDLILFHPLTAYQSLYFLRHGCFDKAGFPELSPRPDVSLGLSSR